MTRNLPLSLCLALAGVCVAAAKPARAQTAAGEITGVVKDQDGAAVPGAAITVTDTRTNLQRVVVSTGDGVYVVASLAPSEYRLDVELAGFKPVRREGLRLATGEKARIDFELAVGGLQEQVTVVADAPALRGESASLGTVVEHEQVVQLPLNGRLFITLAAIAPGVALPPNSLLPRINGGRPRTNEYLFDGISVLQPEPGQVAYYPIVDAIQEFKIESNSPPAEFGRFNGGVVNLTTKSGGNALDGRVFGFFRNEHLNARNVFQRANPTKPAYRRSQYGGVLGGPVARDRTFFFVDYQEQRQQIPANGQFPNTLPRFAPNGYQQLGSPTSTASNFNTSVTEIADTLTWLKGRHTVKLGLDWRWERLNVIQPPWPSGSFTFSTVGSDLPGVTGTGNPLASFLLGQVQTFAISFQRDEIQERAHVQEYFIQDDWKVSDRLTINPGLRYTLNFPSTEINGQTAVFNLQTRQLEYPGDDPVRRSRRTTSGRALAPSIARPTGPSSVRDTASCGLKWPA